MSEHDKTTAPAGDTHDASGSTWSADRARPPTATVRVLVADDHPVVRFGLVSLLNAQPDIEVVGEATSCKECCAAVTRTRPHVVILDLEMGDCRGVQALDMLHERHPDVRIMVYTTHDEEWLVTNAVKTGVHGFVRKDAPHGYVVDAVRAVGAGKYFLDPSVTSKVMGQVGRRNERRRRDRTLSERERDVLRLVVQGMRNKKVSDRLCISERTVKFHMSSLMGKLGASNRTEAVKIALQSGLIPPDGGDRGGVGAPS